MPKIETQPVLAFLIILSFVGIVLIWLFHPPFGDAGAMAVLNTLLGTLGGAFIAIVGFYFGSSQGSKDKDETIGRMAAPEAETLSVTTAAPDGKTGATASTKAAKVTAVPQPSLPVVDLVTKQ